MTRKIKSPAPQDKIELYIRLIEAHPEVEWKGAKIMYTSHNGHMFSFLDPDGVMGLRFPPDQKEQFEKKFQTSPMVQHGRIMKEYVHIPDSLFMQTKKLLPYFQQSYDYVKSLKPKPTKKSSK